METRVYLRRLKVLAVALLISNLVLGGLSFYLLGRVDAEYTALLDKTVPLLNCLRVLVQDVSAVQRTLLNLALSNSAEERASLLQRAEAARSEAEMHLREINRREQGTVFESECRKIEAYYRNYVETATRYQQMLTQAAPMEEVLAFKRDSLRPAYEQLVADLGSVGDHVERWSAEVNGATTAQTKARQTYLLGLAGWPLLALLVIVAVVVPISAILWFVANRLKLDEQP